jgi:hypothetical protein
MYSKSFKAVIAATLFASANAHFFISSPAPIPGNAIKDPLDPSGSNFPCHGADVTQGQVTPLTAGSSFPLAYELGVNGANTAVHGGGSCQVSLTYETDAAKLKDPANWKVIASFLGGCPTNAPGNLEKSVMCSGSGSTACVNSLSFKVPAEVKSGAAVLAWTWFNNVGNREMYMNCAKVSISGGSGSMGSLPSMFVANLASVNQCKTTENFNIQFPNPGAYVTTDSTLNYPLKAPAGTCPGGSGSAAPAASPAYASSAPAAAPAASSPVATSSAANNGQYTGVGASAAPKATPPGGNPGGVFAPGASSAAAPTATSTIATTFVTAVSPAAATSAAATPAAAAPASPAPAPASPAASPATSGSCQSGQVTCTASGFYCIDQTTFGMCAWGCATPMKMSDGTNCSNGAVVHAVNHPKRRKQIRNVHRRHAAGSF